MEIPLAVNAAHFSPRAESLAGLLPDVSERVNDLVSLAQHGLRQMHTSEATAFVQTARGLRTARGSILRGEGDNLRYAAMAALGLALLPVDAQRVVLGGTTAADLTRATAKRAHGHRDPGAVALAAWAAAEVAGTFEPGLFDQLAAVLASGDPVATVDTSWMITAAVAANTLGGTTQVRDQAADRLAAAQGGGGLYPHMLPAKASGRFRAHIGSFADQVYPLQAFARLSGATASSDALSAANKTASTICELQGPAGQWWWHYDSRTGEVVERFPVYSVHQHAMAPMVLFDLADAGGDNHAGDIALGLDWLRTHPEVMDELVSPVHGVVWRKVGRREPAKAVRSVSAVTTSLRPGLHLPGLDMAFPPNKIDYECRPYELGWLLYAWLSGADVKTSPTSD